MTSHNNTLCHSHNVCYKVGPNFCLYSWVFYCTSELWTMSRSFYYTFLLWSLTGCWSWAWLQCMCVQFQTVSPPCPLPVSSSIITSEQSWVAHQLKFLSESLSLLTIYVLAYPCTSQQTIYNPIFVHFTWTLRTHRFTGTSCTRVTEFIVSSLMYSWS